MSDTEADLQRDIAARTHVRDHFPPRCGQDHHDGEIAVIGECYSGGGVRSKANAVLRRHPIGCLLEQERGISVTSSVMQFPYRERIVNLLDTPGHEDFSEDTYRTLTAVDSALMLIDGAKGVEDRTIKLMNVCRLRDTPDRQFC